MKFVIATGGTGGHLFPALMVAQELGRDGHDILFLGSFSRGTDQMNKSGFSFEDLGARGFHMGSWREGAGSVIAMAGAARKALRSLRRFRPDAVIGFGGYGAFPVVFSAALMNYPALIHEQNVIPGRANAMLANFVKRIAISFRKSAKYFSPRKTVFTGCPCHLPRENVDRTMIFKAFRLEEGKITILVFGGSQGSRRINEVFMETAQALKAKLDFQVVHVLGRGDDQKFRERYHQLGIPFALFEFLDKMEDAYHIADLVISRAGAVTVTEIAGFGLPAVLIPYPYARGHQKENASVLRETKTACVIEDHDLSVSKLTRAVLSAAGHRSGAREPGRFRDICVPDAAQRLAREALQLTR